MKSEQFLRLTAPGIVFGTETVVCDLSKFVTAFELPYVKVGQVARCRVDLLMRDVVLEADVERFLVKTFKPRRRALWALRRLGDFTWRVREWVRRNDVVETTRFGATGRSYMQRKGGR